MSDLIKPQGSGGASEETRKVVGGWHAMKEGKRETRQERIIREQHEKAERIKQGLPAEKENNFRPGEEESSGEFNMRKLKESAQKIVKKNTTKSTFVGTPAMLALKLATLFEEKGSKVHVVTVEEAGFDKYRVTYFID